MFSEDIKLINNFHTIMGHSNNSIKAYNTVFNKYRNFHKMSLSKLLKEALYDQEMKIPQNKLKVYNRIIDFRNHIIRIHVKNTVLSQYSKIKTFYKCYGVNLPYIPPINRNYLKHNDFIRYDDLLKKSEIKKAYTKADDDLKLWIMVMLSSGSSRNECYKMTNEMFLKGTMEYHRKTNFQEALINLSKRNDVICRLDLIRQKTNKPYYTFLSPETVQLIALIKLKTNDLNPNDYLLKHNIEWLGRQCRLMNDNLKLGYAGGYVRFRPHMFRKFFASNFNTDENIINSLQGRSKNKIHDAYFKENPNYLKLIYAKGLDNISLFHKYSINISDDIVIVKSINLD